MHGWAPYTAVHYERMRAHAKHDGKGGSMERKDWDDPAWLPVLLEEVGEVARAICEHRHLASAPEILREELENELIQVAAMTMAWVDALHDVKLQRQLDREHRPCLPFCETEVRS